MQYDIIYIYTHTQEMDIISNELKNNKISCLFLTSCRPYEKNIPANPGKLKKNLEIMVHWTQERILIHCYWVQYLATRILIN
jgi:hypothetical protein